MENAGKSFPDRFPNIAEPLGDRITKVQERLTHLGYKANFVAWQQGESELATPREVYSAALGRLAARVMSKFGTELTVAISTLCQAGAYPHVQSAIREAVSTGII